jgi:hypothetical protein
MTGREQAHLVDNVVYGWSRDWPEHIVQVCNVDYGHNKAADSDHIVLSDPQDAIARCEAELAILDEHAPSEAAPDTCRCCKGSMAVPCPTIRRLGSGYRHRPGYLEDWRP